MNPQNETLIRHLRSLETRVAKQLPIPLEELNNLEEWQGAGVRITRRPVVFQYANPFDFWDDSDVVITTPHVLELSWLFVTLRDAFSERVDWSNKYYFYGTLAEVALAHIARHGAQRNDYRPLLFSVINEAIRQVSFI